MLKSPLSSFPFKLMQCVNTVTFLTAFPFQTVAIKMVTCLPSYVPQCDHVDHNHVNHYIINKKINRLSSNYSRSSSFTVCLLK